MSLEVSLHNKYELDSKSIRIPKSMKFWNDLRYVNFLSDCRIMIAKRKETLVGFWIIPIMDKRGVTAAKREIRLFPYHAPWLTGNSNEKRRRTFTAMIKLLKNEVDEINLPMSPDFQDVSAAIAHGCFAEWRHTHRFHKSDKILESFSPKLRGHVNAAMRNVKIIEINPNNFEFNKAIKNSVKYEIKQRSKLALEFNKNGQGFALQAKRNSNVLGELFISTDDTTAYYYHSWFDRLGPRGVPSYLIKEALDWTFFERGLKYFDFEGSIIANVDTYFSSFNAQITPYAHIYWAPDKHKLTELLMNTMNIQGREAL